MKYINVFDTESEFNDVKSSLDKPLVSYIKENDKVYCLSESAGPVPPTPTVTLVDLGLSVKWASCNVGATCRSEYDSWYGTYFAWGEIEGKEYYDWTNYKYGTESSLTKYNSIDGKTILDSEDDAAYTIQALRMPTKAEFEELLDSDKIEATYEYSYLELTGLHGLLLTSKVPGYEGNSIFIPECGLFGYEDFHGYCWASSLNRLNDTTAYRLNFTFDMFEEGLTVNIDTTMRKDGFPIRGVQDKN